MDIAVRTTGLTKRYASREVVSSLDLSVHRGDIYGFLGPNGAGKTTTMRMIVGLVKPTSGSVEVCGFDLKAHRLEVLRRTGALIDIPAFYPRLTALDNLRVIASLRGVAENKKLVELLEAVGLPVSHQRLQYFSHGMKQRLAIAQALVGEPEVLILDEPTTGLDPEGKEDILRLISSLARNFNCTVILSSHLLDEVELICNRMGIIKDGKLILEGSVNELLGSADSGRITVRVSEPERALELLRGTMEVILDNDGRLEIRADQQMAPYIARRLCSAGLSVYELTSKKLTLRDLFMKVVRSEEVERD